MDISRNISLAYFLPYIYNTICVSGLQTVLCYFQKEQPARGSTINYIVYKFEQPAMFETSFANEIYLHFSLMHNVYQYEKGIEGIPSLYRCRSEYKYF